jgi:hypothetical protein
MKMIRRKIQILILAALLVQSTLALGAETANYYRVWQGFKKQDLSEIQFVGALPSFLRSTTQLYKDSLNQYLVGVPPFDKPNYIPDEFALLAFGSETSYQAIRATPEGQAYGESHWQIFDKSRSGSLKLESELPGFLSSGKAYNALGKPNDWKSGTTGFFIGLRKANLSSDEFLRKLSQHVRLAASSLKPLGLKGYIIIVQDNYEVAYMNWSSEAAMKRAFEMPAGQRVAQDASSFLETLQWSSEQIFDLTQVQFGNFYRTK